MVSLHHFSAGTVDECARSEQLLDSLFEVLLAQSFYDALGSEALAGAWATREKYALTPEGHVERMLLRWVQR